MKKGNFYIEQKRLLKVLIKISRVDCSFKRAVRLIHKVNKKTTFPEIREKINEVLDKFFKIIYGVHKEIDYYFSTLEKWAQESLKERFKACFYNGKIESNV